MSFSLSRFSIRKFLPRWFISLPVFLLILFSGINFFRVYSEKATPWASGGWALHSTYDSMLFRFVRLYGIKPDGSRERIEDLKYRQLSEPIITRPIKKSARAFIKNQHKRGILKKGGFKKYEVEVWQYTFSSGDPQLGAKLIAKHTVGGGANE